MAIAYNKRHASVVKVTFKAINLRSRLKNPVSIVCLLGHSFTRDIVSTNFGSVRPQAAIAAAKIPGASAVSHENKLWPLSFSICHNFIRSTRRKFKTCEEDKQLASLISAGTNCVTIVAKAWDLHVDHILEARVLALV